MTNSSQLPRRPLSLVICLLLAMPALAGAERGRRDREERRRGREMVTALVYFNQRPAAADDSRLNARLGNAGGQHRRQMRRLPMREVTIPRRKLARLRSLPNVRFVVEDTEISTFSIVSREAANEPGYGAINDSYTGLGVTVAVVDSGVAAHEDFPNLKQYSFVGGNYPALLLDNGELSPYDTSDEPLADQWGHGTHVAGIISGTGYASGGDYRGVASRAELVSLRVLDHEGKGSAADLIAALDWLLEYKEVFGIRVVNMSLGKGVDGPAEFDPLTLAAEALWDAGVTVVCAAGNLGWNGNFTIHSPGNSRKVITVGSLTDAGTGFDFTDDYVSTFSSQGPTGFDLFLKPDLVAPGNRVVAASPETSGLKSLLPQRVVDCTETGCSDGYLEMSGTSMATPMVAATVARMLEKDPNLTPDTVKARLMRSARKMAGDATAQGAGLLDIDAALDETGVVAAAPSPRFIPNLDGSTSVEDTAALWGVAGFEADAVFPEGALGVPGEDGLIQTQGFEWADSLVHSDGFVWSDGKTRAASFLVPAGNGTFELNDD